MQSNLHNAAYCRHRHSAFPSVHTDPVEAVDLELPILVHPQSGFTDLSNCTCGLCCFCSFLLMLLMLRAVCGRTDFTCSSNAPSDKLAGSWSSRGWRVEDSSSNSASSTSRCCCSCLGDGGSEVIVFIVIVLIVPFCIFSSFSSVVGIICGEAGVGLVVLLRLPLCRRGSFVAFPISIV